MMYEEFIRDFAERSEANLNAIEKLKNQSDPKVYEVTQLINSTLGILIFPVEEYIKKLDLKGIFVDDEFDEIRKEIKFIKGSKTIALESFLVKLRNSFAHNNIEVKGGKDIERLLLWNRWDRNSAITWQVEISVETLKRLLFLVLDKLKNSVMLVAGRGAA